MNLPVTDIEYIDSRLDEHELKYQEVYDEIRDHVLMAMETARAGGDERDIECIYNDMMATQFPGYYAFERIAIACEKAYRDKIKKTVWANVRYYLSPLNVIVIALALIAGYNLPETQTTYIAMLVVLLIVSAMPVIYARIKSARIKTDNGKESIVRTYITNRATLFLNYYLAMVGINLFTHTWNTKSFDAGNHNPRVNLFVVAFAVIYGLSIGRLCRQEIKSPILNINA